MTDSAFDYDVREAWQDLRACDQAELDRPGVDGCPHHFSTEIRRLVFWGRNEEHARRRAERHARERKMGAVLEEF